MFLIIAGFGTGFITGMLCTGIYRIADSRSKTIKKYSFSSRYDADMPVPEADRDILEKGRKDRSAGEFR